MAARARSFRLIVTVSALVASAMTVVAGGAHAAPPAGSTQPTPWFPKGKVTRAHLSTVLNRVAQPAVAAGSARAQADAAGTPPSGPGSLLRFDAARLRVDIRVGATDSATLSALSAAGAHVTFVSAANHTVTAAVKPVDLVKVGSVAGVQYVAQIYTPMVARTSLSGGRPGAKPASTTATCPSGSVVSEGDAILNAATARTHFGVDGTGVTVGLLSDSFAADPTPVKTQAQDVASGDLPGAANPCGHTTPVNNLDDTETDLPPTDEGRAMAQTVHDLAPGADLAFATAFTGPEAFASNIESLATTAGAKVIVDDVTYADEPMYQDGVISNAVSSVTASGVSYFTAAANNNVVYTDSNNVRHNVGSYEAGGGYRSTTCPAAVHGVATYLDCHNFRTSGSADNTYGMTVKPGGFVRLDLQWAQPLFGVTSDFDVFLLNSSGAIIAGSADDNLASDHPFEFMEYQNDTALSQAVRVVIARFAGPKPRFKFVHLENGATGLTAFEYRASSGTDVIGPAIFGHNGADKAGSVAAVPFDDPTTPEYYSSRGPVTLLYGPVNGISPASKLGSPQVLHKPDFAATDCVQNTFFGFEDPPGTPPWRFCGTSDAAPHAAGVAALLLENSLSATPAQVRNALATTAATVTNGSTASTGAGRLDADAARESTTVTLPPTAVKPGEEATITATVHGFGATPTGTVTFSVDSTPVATDVPLVSGQATYSTSTLPVGNHPVSVEYSGDATHVPASGAGNIAVDGTPPVPSITEPAHLFPASKTIIIRFSATDTISGVANYDVQYKVAAWDGMFGDYIAPPSWSGITATTRTLIGSPGHEYCFQVRATDKAANLSNWSSDHCAVVPLDDRDLGLETGGWSRGTSSGAYLGTVTRTTTAGAKLRKTGAHLNRIAVIVSQCSTCGRIAIYFNGTLWRTISTHASSTHYKVVLIQPTVPVRVRTIELKALDPGKKVVIDGLSIARPL